MDNLLLDPLDIDSVKLQILLRSVFSTSSPHNDQFHVLQIIGRFGKGVPSV